jgi:hypothetical protein
LDKGKKFKEGSWEVWGIKEFYVMFFPWGKEENECVRRKLVIMCEVSFMEKNVCKQWSMEGNHV